MNRPGGPPIIPAPWWAAKDPYVFACLAGFFASLPAVAFLRAVTTLQWLFDHNAPPRVVTGLGIPLLACFILGLALPTWFGQRICGKSLRYWLFFVTGWAAGLFVLLAVTR